MTGDQRLILKIEHAVAELDKNQLIAAYHVLDEILDELEPQMREAVPQAEPARPAVAAAG